MVPRKIWLHKGCVQLPLGRMEQALQLGCAFKQCHLEVFYNLSELSSFIEMPMSHETKQGAMDQDQVKVTWLADNWRRRVALGAGMAKCLLTPSTRHVELLLVPPLRHTFTSQDAAHRQWWVENPKRIEKGIRQLRLTPKEGLRRSEGKYVTGYIYNGNAKASSWKCV